MSIFIAYDGYLLPNNYFNNGNYFYTTLDDSTPFDQYQDLYTSVINGLTSYNIQYLNNNISYNDYATKFQQYVGDNIDIAYNIVCNNNSCYATIAINLPSGSTIWNGYQYVYNVIGNINSGHISIISTDLNPQLVPVNQRLADNGSTIVKFYGANDISELQPINSSSSDVSEGNNKTSVSLLNRNTDNVTLPFPDSTLPDLFVVSYWLEKDLLNILTLRLFSNTLDKNSITKIEVVIDSVATTVAPVYSTNYEGKIDLTSLISNLSINSLHTLKLNIYVNNVIQDDTISDSLSFYINSSHNIEMHYGMIDNNGCIYVEIVSIKKVYYNQISPNLFETINYIQCVDQNFYCGEKSYLAVVYRLHNNILDGGNTKYSSRFNGNLILNCFNTYIFRIDSYTLLSVDAPIGSPNYINSHNFYVASERIYHNTFINLDKLNVFIEGKYQLVFNINTEYLGSGYIYKNYYHKYTMNFIKNTNVLGGTTFDSALQVNKSTPFNYQHDNFYKKIVKLKVTSLNNFKGYIIYMKGKQVFNNLSYCVINDDLTLDSNYFLFNGTYIIQAIINATNLNINNNVKNLTDASSSLQAALNFNAGFYFILDSGYDINNTPYTVSLDIEEASVVGTNSLYTTDTLYTTGYKRFDNPVTKVPFIYNELSYSDSLKYLFKSNYSSAPLSSWPLRWPGYIRMPDTTLSPSLIGDNDQLWTYTTKTFVDGIEIPKTAYVRLMDTTANNLLFNYFGHDGEYQSITSGYFDYVKLSDLPVQLNPNVLHKIECHYYYNTNIDITVLEEYIVMRSDGMKINPYAVCGYDTPGTNNQSAFAITENVFLELNKEYFFSTNGSYIMVSNLYKANLSAINGPIILPNSLYSILINIYSDNTYTTILDTKTLVPPCSDILYISGEDFTTNPASPSPYAYNLIKISTPNVSNVEYFSITILYTRVFVPNSGFDPNVDGFDSNGIMYPMICNVTTGYEVLS
jgi:hypothetical protein